MTRLPRFTIIRRYRRLSVRFHYEGKPRQFAVHSESEQDARMLIRSIEDAILAGKFDGSRLSIELPVPTQGGGVTFGKAVDEWAKLPVSRGKRKGKPRNQRNVDTDVKALNKVGRDKSITTVDAKVIGGFLSGYDDRPYRFNRVRSALLGVMKNAQKQGWIKVVPDFPDQKPEEERHYELTDDEVDRILAELDSETGQWVRFAVGSGARRSEVAGLLWRDVDMQNQMVTFRETKTAPRRDVPVSPDALAVLKERKDVDPTRVFAGLEAGDVSKRFRKAARRAKVYQQPVDKSTGEIGPAVYPRFHDLRHTYASRLRKAAVPDSTIMDACGWESPAMVRRYGKGAAAFAAVFAAMGCKTETGSETGGNSDKDAAAVSC